MKNKKIVIKVTAVVLVVVGILSIALFSSKEPRVKETATLEVLPPVEDSKEIRVERYIQESTDGLESLIKNYTKGLESDRNKQIKEKADTGKEKIAEFLEIKSKELDDILQQKHEYYAKEVNSSEFKKRNNYYSEDIAELLKANKATLMLEKENKLKAISSKLMGELQVKLQELADELQIKNDGMIDVYKIDMTKGLEESIIKYKEEIYSK